MRGTWCCCGPQSRAERPVDVGRTPGTVRTPARVGACRLWPDIPARDYSRDNTGSFGTAGTAMSAGMPNIGWMPVSLPFLQARRRLPTGDQQFGVPTNPPHQLAACPAPGCPPHPFDIPSPNLVACLPFPTHDSVRPKTNPTARPGRVSSVSDLHDATTDVPPPRSQDSMSHTPDALSEGARVGMTAWAACTPFGWV